MPHDQAPASTRRRLLRPATIAPSLAALVLVAYIAVCALAPTPQPVVSFSVEAAATFTANGVAAQRIVDAQEAPTAVGWVTDPAEGVTETWANSDAAVPIASISKVVTALVVLDARPLAPGEDGRTHVWSADDAARQAKYLARDGIVFPIPVGTEVTEREMLTLALLPSANDFAAAYAVSAFGSVDAFADAANQWARDQGLESLTIVEPTGLDARNSASPADVARLGGLAVANPTITEITRQRSARLPWGIGEVRNTNPLLGSLDGTIGLKTGFTGAAGYALLAAQEDEVSGVREASGSDSREVVKIVVTLDRTSEKARARQTAAVLRALDGLEQTLDLVTDGEVVGMARTVDGREVSLTATQSSQAALLPGERASREVDLGKLAAGPAGQSAGTITVTTPQGETAVPIEAAAALEDPDLWWRLTHPGELLVP